MKFVIVAAMVCVITSVIEVIIEDLIGFDRQSNPKWKRVTMGVYNIVCGMIMMLIILHFLPGLVLPITGK